MPVIEWRLPRARLSLAWVGIVAVFMSAGLLGWYYFLGLTLSAIRGGIDTDALPIFWLYDWHVHYAGANALVEKTIYLYPIEVPGWPLPVDVFNLPPTAALIAVPLLPLGRELGGIVWLIGGVTALTAAGWVTLRLLRIDHAVTWLGIAFGIYAATWPFFLVNVTLGNVNNLMLLIVVVFALAHQLGHGRAAGIALGLAIGIKVWPVALLVFLVRDRSWRTLRWTAVALALQLLIFVLWIGPRIVPDALEAIATPVPLDPGVIIMWTTWAREALDWWPRWAPIVLAVGLLAIPVRGRAGMGLAMLAGLSLIPNVWDHYLGAFVLAFLLIGSDAWRQLNLSSRLRDRFSRRWRSAERTDAI